MDPIELEEVDKACEATLANDCVFFARDKERIRHKSVVLIAIMVPNNLLRYPTTTQFYCTVVAIQIAQLS
jgi:hypothetical protein